MAESLAYYTYQRRAEGLQDEDELVLGVRVEVDAADAQPRGDARQQPLGQVHGVGDGHDGEVRGGGPFEEVVDDALPGGAKQDARAR